MAVIGMACRFPGASGADELWDLLRDGADVTSETPPDRYDVDALYSSAGGTGTIGSRRAGYVDGMADFDAEFFGMSHNEAVDLDPQHRLLMMATWEALEDAGQRPDALAGSRTSVFVGNTRSDFLERQFRQGLESVTASAFHNFRPLLPARISYVFDFRGPSIVVDTACSSSLAAVHAAVQSLRTKESPLAVVAGVNLALRPDEGVMMTQSGTLAGDGRSKFGDADADGFAPSDGVGVVILKPLAEARADGDRIRAVIRGSAVSNDGRTSESLLTPSVAGQTEVLRWAYEDAGVSPADVDFVEAHGTGSPAFDPVEFTALGEVLGEGRPSDRPLFIGSVKTNIGHAEAAGSMAGLMKTVLCMEHGQMPPSLHLNTPNPLVAWGELPLEVPTKLQDLPDRGRPVLAGITGQGASCLNAHLVVAQGDTHTADSHATLLRRPMRSNKAYVLPISARSPEALDALARAYTEYLGPGGAGADLALRDICFSAATRRQHHAHRLAVTGTSHEEMIAALDCCLTGTDPGYGKQARTLTPVVERYRNGEAVDWDPLFRSRCRFVPLPNYQWQTKRYWPGEKAAEEDAGDLASAVLREHARTSHTEFTDSSLLSDIGIDSLARLQIVVKLASDHNYEVEAEELAELRTVGELRNWLDALEAQTV
ncbi:type I polyketide synthase [Streptomyces albidus (ex Kaewkla and Franco 2022)]|uniref:type I polyketide synthase n=1 Tax=Streptomyces albidus (ex Kaewkla and Franco 2022) TaxID=722709 RepID=UPI00281591F7|nr:beta-ketoacyl synthase N-terminal-like domain-containing protein [Streptomyces albidus (ex Kaewkla and Franco 2022)]